MYKRGVILELRGREAVVFNDAGEYEKIKRLEGMIVGQVVKYNKAINNQANRLLKSISVAAVLIAVLFSYSIFKVSREQVFAYVTLDITPSMEFSINSDNNVLGIRALNLDAEEITKSIEVKGKKINDVVSEVMGKMEKLGYISSDKKTVILLSTAANASLDKDDKRNIQIDKTMDSIEETVKNCTKNQAHVESISSTSEIRNLSIEADMSLGRYVLYTKVLEKGENISIQDAKAAPLSQLVQKSEIDKDNSDLTDSTQNSPGDLSQANKPTLNKNEDEDKPEVHKPGIDKPGIDKPEIDKTGVDKPGIDKPGIYKPGIDKSEIEKPEIDKPEIDKPEIDKPGIYKPGIDKPEIDTPEIDKPEIEKPETDKPEIDKPGIGRPGIGRPGIGRPDIDRPGIDRPEIDKPGIDKPGTDKPAIDKPIITDKSDTLTSVDSPRFDNSYVFPSPGTTTSSPSHTSEIPEPTPSATHPLRIRERRGW